MNYRYFLKLVFILFCINSFNPSLADTCELQCRMETVNPNDMYGQEVCEYVCYGEVTVTGVQQNNQYDWPQLDFTTWAFESWIYDLSYWTQPYDVTHTQDPEQKKIDCLTSADLVLQLCNNQAANNYVDEIVDCGKLFFNDNLIAQCNLGANAMKEADLETCKTNDMLSRRSCNNL